MASSPQVFNIVHLEILTLNWKGFEPKALEILKQKKNGSYIVIEADVNYVPPEMEYREVYGVVFSQKRNFALISEENLKDISTQEKSLSAEARRDLLVATITLKYTQSNSVGYAINGQMIGVGAGQQSRVDCAKLAGLKVKNWHLRFHPKVAKLPFKSGVKRVDRTNARIHYIDNTLSSSDLELFDKIPEPLTPQEKDDWMRELQGVSMSSDAFFPFRDSIDVASRLGVKYVAQPGGSIQDENVVSACNEFKMVMATTGVRLFHH
jgi:phosphoribosylaminoimidazolecarboxamide formyltransferase/IMP cyclohydrolase